MLFIKAFFILAYDLFTGGLLAVHNRVTDWQNSEEYGSWFVNDYEPQTRTRNYEKWQIGLSYSLAIMGLAWVLFLSAFFAHFNSSLQKRFQHKQHTSILHEAPKLNQNKIRIHHYEFGQSRLEEKLSGSESRKTEYLSLDHPRMGYDDFQKTIRRDLENQIENWDDSSGESAFRYTAPEEAINYREIARAIGTPKSIYGFQVKGEVEIEIIVNTKGQYLAHKVHHSTHTLLTAAVEKEIRNLRFEPVFHRGKPIHGSHLVVFYF